MQLTPVPRNRSHASCRLNGYCRAQRAAVPHYVQQNPSGDVDAGHTKISVARIYFSYSSRFRIFF